ncbi:MAG: asparagine synthase-related protein [Nitrospiraceae bacterium]
MEISAATDAGSLCSAAAPEREDGLGCRWFLAARRQEWAEDLLDEDRLRRESYFHPAPIREKWIQHLSGAANWQYHLWDVLMFQAWLPRGAWLAAGVEFSPRLLGIRSSAGLRGSTARSRSIPEPATWRRLERSVDSTLLQQVQQFIDRHQAEGEHAEHSIPVTDTLLDSSYSLKACNGAQHRFCRPLLVTGAGEVERRG